MDIFHSQDFQFIDPNWAPNHNKLRWGICSTGVKDLKILQGHIQPITGPKVSHAGPTRILSGDF